MPYTIFILYILNYDSINKLTISSLCGLVDILYIVIKLVVSSVSFILTLVTLFNKVL